jgi:Polyketide cyclase / dehydrase and lipid transport
MDRILPSRFAVLVSGLLVTTFTPTRADIPLPAITVTGQTPVGDMVYRDRQQRSRDVRWPSVISKFIDISEIFAHNEIDINASSETVWNHLVQAKLWPQWCSFVKKVKIWGDSDVLEKGTQFWWRAYDLPQEGFAVPGAGVVYPDPLSSKVFEYVPETRLGWRSYGAMSVHGSVCETYHYWLLTPIGPKKTRVLFEEVAEGGAAGFARGNHPEIVHVNHQQWLEELKKVSETKS